MIIKNGVSNPDVYCNLDGLDYPKGQWTLTFNNVTINSDGTLNEPNINVGIRSKYDIEYVLVQPQPITSWMNEAGVRYSDLDTLLIDLNTYFDFSDSTFSNSSSDIVISDDYSLLPPTGEENKIYITENDYTPPSLETLTTAQVNFRGGSDILDCTDQSLFSIGDLIMVDVGGQKSYATVIAKDSGNQGTSLQVDGSSWKDINGIDQPYNSNFADYEVFYDAYLVTLPVESTANSMYRWDGSKYVKINLETDPTVPAHVKDITTQDIIDWDNKLDSYTETDTLDSVTDRNSVTTNNITIGGLTATNLANSSGDITFNKFLKQRPDGTVGSEAFVNNDWSLTGNSNINESTNFIGTITDHPLIFKTYNINSGRIDANGVSIGRLSGNGNKVRNIAIGSNTLQNTVGVDNTAIGHSVLNLNTTGNNNTGIGSRSLQNNIGGSSNVGVGLNSMFVNNNGSQNTGVGVNSLGLLAGSSSNNVGVGFASLNQSTSGSNNIGLGANTQVTDTLSNQINIGNFLYKDNVGNFGINTTTPTSDLDVNGDTIRIRNERTIIASTNPGIKGEICWDLNYLYVCIDTNTWKRVALNSW